MRIERRVAKLEQERAANSATLMDRYWAHLDRVALRLYGRRMKETDGDVRRIWEEGDEFVQSLREDELERFLVELEAARATLAG
jgi:hypothetical protein